MIPPEDRYPHAPLPFRPRLTWPGGARLAVWVCPNIEHYEFLPAQIGSPRDPWPRTPHPDVLSYSLKDYGNRAGVWRMMECLDAHGIRGSVSFSMSVGEMFPEILDAMIRFNAWVEDGKIKRVEEFVDARYLEAYERFVAHMQSAAAADG